MVTYKRFVTGSRDAGVRALLQLAQLLGGVRRGRRAALRARGALPAAGPQLPPAPPPRSATVL